MLAGGNNEHTNHAPEMEVPVIVLCGGLATRLADVTQGKLPKHLLEAGNQTILEYALEPYSKFEKIILATSNHADQIESFVHSRLDEKQLLLSPEPKPLGVIDAVEKAITRYNISGRFMMANGDEVALGFEPTTMLSQHIASGSELTILTTTFLTSTPDFAFTIDQESRALNFKRTQELKNDEVATNFALGTFVCEESILPTMTDHKDWVSFLRVMTTDHRLHVYTTDIPFYNINHPGDLEKLRSAV